MAWHYETPNGRLTTWAELLERFEEWKRDQSARPLREPIMCLGVRPRPGRVGVPCQSYTVPGSEFCSLHQSGDQRRTRQRPELRIVS